MPFIKWKSPEPRLPMKKTTKTPILTMKQVLIIVGLICGGSFLIHIICEMFLFHAPKIAYVDTGKLMVGFNEANKVDRELKEKDAEWKKQLKILKDSLAAHVELMGKEYNDASAKRKKELQDLLSAQNQQVNNFREANLKRLQKLSEEKLKSVYDKVNVYVAEYGKKHNYSIIFGTVAGGSIVYGNQDSYDITTDIIAGLNERYK